MTEVLLGAVAYDSKVVTIWDGFRALLRERGVDFDYVLYSNYERQVEDLLAGQIDVAWNSPLAWVRARRLAASAGVVVRPVAMRDSDRGLRSVLAVRADAEIVSVADLRGKRVGVGAIDSPQATLLPLSLLRAHGIRPEIDVEVVYHNVGVGLHGDHIGGERHAAAALRDRQVEGAFMTDTNLLLFGREGTLPGGAVRVVAETLPYDHCNLTAGPGVHAEAIDALIQALLNMSYADPAVRPLLDLEGLKQWLPGRVDGYPPLEIAVDESGFYDPHGVIGAVDYRP